MQADFTDCRLTPDGRKPSRPESGIRGNWGTGVPDQKRPEFLLRREDFVQRCNGELRVIKGQQYLEVGDRLVRKPPLATLVDTCQRRFNSQFGNPELFFRAGSIPGSLQEPTQIHCAHQFIDEMSVSMTAPARDQREMMGERLFACRRTIHR